MAVRRRKKDKHTHKLDLDLKATLAMNICCIVNSETRLTPFIKLNLLYWCVVRIKRGKRMKRLQTMSQIKTDLLSD